LLDVAWATLEAHGDTVNAAHARNLAARYLLLIGRLDEAERRLAGIDPSLLPSVSCAAFELTRAGIAIRRLKIGEARKALAKAAGAARQADIPALITEVEAATLALGSPAARIIVNGEERPVLLDEIEALFAADFLVIDACQNVVHDCGDRIFLASRPVLFTLVRCLAEAWPGDVSRDTLLKRTFHARHADDSQRARLRVEIARLRGELQKVAEITATEGGFLLTARNAGKVVVLAPAVEEKNAAILAFLADGEAWSSSALAIALGASARTVQRALEELAADNKVRAVGRGRMKRWTVPSVPGFPTTLLLPGSLPGSQATFMENSDPTGEQS